jgi:glycosyltransferase involved in cell wall biosynthesis
MPRLLILCEYPTLLGGERSMLATLPAVTTEGFDVTVAAPVTGPLAAALRERNVTHAIWPTHDEIGQRLPLDRLRAELAKPIQRARPDLLHANSLSTARIAGPAASAAGVRSIGHFRDIIKLTSQAVEDINRHARLLAVSEATRDVHVDQGVDASKCFVLYNGVNLNEFRPHAPCGYLHRELNLPSDARLVVVIGQLGLRKGTEVALAAAQQIAAEMPDVHWLIVGQRTSNKPESMEFEASLRSLASEPPLAGCVHFLGARSDIPQLMNECTLLVHAARQEPLGRVFLEAAASGLPAVATDVGGTREIYPSELDGAVLICPDDYVQLAATVRSLLADDARRKAIAHGARRRAEAAFDIRIAATRLVEHYQSALA